MLAPLGNYGGPTKTHALLPASPAIDSGRDLFTRQDQRGRSISDFPGIPNVEDGSDIGAFERQPDDLKGGSRKFDSDGDSKTDIGIFRPGPGEWWYLRSSNGGNNAFQFGASTNTIVGPVALVTARLILPSSDPSLESGLYCRPMTVHSFVSHSVQTATFLSPANTTATEPPTRPCSDHQTTSGSNSSRQAVLSFEFWVLGFGFVWTGLEPFSLTREH